MGLCGLKLCDSEWGPLLSERNIRRLISDNVAGRAKTSVEQATQSPTELVLPRMRRNVTFGNKQTTKKLRSP
jgi:hypothetical protein